MAVTGRAEGSEGSSWNGTEVSARTLQLGRAEWNVGAKMGMRGGAVGVIGKAMP